MFEAGALQNLFAFVGQTTIVIVAAVALLRLLMIGSPSIRYGALRLLLAACLALPFVQPRVQIAPSTLESIELPAAPGTSVPPRTAAAPSNTPAVPLGPRWPAAVALLLIAGALLRAGWTVAGLLRLRALRRAGRLAATDDHAELQDWIATHAVVRYVDGLGQPVTFGFRTPIVLLPERLRAMPPYVQRAVLAHELWHVRRRDWTWTVAEEALRAVLWFHPGMWILLSEIQSAREQVVDELTVLLTGSRKNYLDALLAFADERPLLSAAAFARRRHLVQRMLLISKEGVMSPRRIVVSGAVLCVTLAMTGWQAIEALPLTEVAQMPRDPRRPQPPPPAPARRVLTETDALQAIQADPSPANYFRLATLYWEKAFKDHTLTPAEKATTLLLGINATDAALAQDPEFIEAMIYKNIMLRMQANASTDPEEQKRLISEADTLRNKAIELRKANPEANASRSALPPGMPPPPPPPPPPGPVTEVDGVAPLRIGGNINAPTKIRSVNPVYPPEAQASRVQGVVILETVIDGTGRVREARVLRSVPMLDQAAIEAVLQWEFVPTLLNGVPVPVIMTTTVNFTLQ
jgi:TonB family protein